MFSLRASSLGGGVPRELARRLSNVVGLHLVISAEEEKEKEEEEEEEEKESVVVCFCSNILCIYFRANRTTCCCFLLQCICDYKSSLLPTDLIR